MTSPADLTYYRIELSYACGAIVVKDHLVTDLGAPIFNWLKGRNLAYASNWVEKKNGTITKMEG